MVSFIATAPATGFNIPVMENFLLKERVPADLFTSRIFIAAILPVVPPGKD
jgi:hypothetical protein